VVPHVTLREITPDIEFAVLALRDAGLAPR
jgi:hypothetical protein